MAMSMEIVDKIVIYSALFVTIASCITCIVMICCVYKMYGDILLGVAEKSVRNFKWYDFNFK